MKRRRLRQRILGIVMCVVLVSCLATFPGVKEERDRGKQPITEVQDVPEKVIVHTTPPCESGSIVVYAENERIFSYYGKIDILNSGWNGKPIKIVVHVEGENMGASEEEVN